VRVYSHQARAFPTRRSSDLRPIAGTRPRGKTEGEDLELEQELKTNEKERAEHIMLVDLGRNDIVRVCEFSSVRPKELMFVERYRSEEHTSELQSEWIAYAVF